MARLPTKEELAAFLAAHGIVDFISGGRLTRAEQKVVWKAIKRLGPPVATGVGRAALGGAGAIGTGLGATAYGVGKVATRGAIPLGMAMTAYDAYEMGKRDAELGFPAALQQLPVPQLASPRFAEDVGLPTKIDVLTPALRVRKKVSTYAKNVGKAMKAVKASSKGGRKGKLSSPKTTFRKVSKTVSKIMKGGKRPRGGITGIISKAVKGSFKRKPKKTRSSRPSRRY